MREISKLLKFFLSFSAIFATTTIFVLGSQVRENNGWKSMNFFNKFSDKSSDVIHTKEKYRSLKTEDDSTKATVVHDSKSEPFGFQSVNSRGHDIAMSVSKAPDGERSAGGGYFVTGTTTGLALTTEFETALHAGMHCFVAQLKPFESDWFWFKKYGAYKGDEAVSTTCTSITVMKDSLDGQGAPRIVVVGYTEGNRIFNPQDGVPEFAKDGANPENKVNGFAILLELPHFDKLKKPFSSMDVKLLGGKMLDDFSVQYPVSVKSLSDTDFVVGQLVTDDDGTNIQYALSEELGKASIFEPGYKYGNQFTVRLERLSYDKELEVIRKEWGEAFGTKETERRSAYVWSVEYDQLRDVILFAGYTNGHGEVFGTVDNLSTDGSDVDGYIAKVDANTGKFTGTNSAEPESFATRIFTQPSKDEFVNSICIHGRALYVVGSTTGMIDPTMKERKLDDTVDAFVQKRTLDTMKVIWTKQISKKLHTNENGDIPSVHGYGCKVGSMADESEAVVYVSGTVDHASVVENGSGGNGGKDIYVAALRIEDGEKVEKFKKIQIGSELDDYVAKDRGGLEVDEHGNAVLFGTTKGELLGVKEQTRDGDSSLFQYADIFLMNFLPDGKHVVPVKPSYSSTHAAAEPESKKKKHPIVIFFIVLLSIVVVTGAVSFAFHIGKIRTETLIEQQQDQDIARYLEEFENGNMPNIAAGQFKDTDNEAIEESSYSFATGEDITGGTASTTYDDLMESYKNIMGSESIEDDTPPSPVNQETSDLKKDDDDEIEII